MIIYQDNCNIKINKILNTCSINRTFNPTACVFEQQYYMLFRCESFSLNHKLIGLRNWGKSKSSYWMEVYDKNIKPVNSKGNVKFRVGKNSYYKVKRNNAGLKKFIFEDIRIIHNTQFINDDNELCCYASFNACIKYKKNIKNSKVGICLVNFSKCDVEFIDYISLNSQAKFDKNWGVFLHNNKYYAIYSINPLIYSSSENLKTISFGNNLLKFTNIKISISCNPLKINSNEFLVVVHKKYDVFGYNFYLMKFNINNGIIELSKEKKELRIPKIDYFICSLIENNNKLLILGGVKNKYSIYFQIDKI